MDNIYNDNNVYILGAGFSADGHLPLIKDFIFRMRETPEWLESNKFYPSDKRIEYFKKVFDFRLKATGSAYRINLNIEDIEQLFSLANAKESSKLNTAIIESIASTLDYCRKSKDEKLINGFLHKSKLHDFSFAKPKTFLSGASVEDHSQVQLRLYDYYVLAMLNMLKSKANSNNTFISFNYDTLIEESIWNIGQKVNYGLDRVAYSEPALFDTVDGIQILKLHGSVNWTLPGTKGQAMKIFRNYDEAYNSGKTKVILPPTWHKVFLGSLEKLWSKTVDAITNATRVIVIGFSIPETDIHFKYLLSAGLQDNISLRQILFINPMSAEEFEIKASKIFHRSFLESGYLSHISTKSDRFFLDMHALKNINRENDLFKIHEIVHGV